MWYPYDSCKEYYRIIFINIENVILILLFCVPNSYFWILCSLINVYLQLNFIGFHNCCLLCWYISLTRNRKPAKEGRRAMALSWIAKLHKRGSLLIVNDKSHLKTIRALIQKRELNMIFMLVSFTINFGNN